MGGNFGLVNPLALRGSIRVVGSRLGGGGEEKVGVPVSLGFLS